MIRRYRIYVGGVSSDDGRLTTATLKAGNTIGGFTLYLGRGGWKAGDALLVEPCMVWEIITNNEPSVLAFAKYLRTLFCQTEILFTVELVASYTVAENGVTLKL